MAEPHWTPKMVAVYLDEAADTLHRLPNRRVGGYVSTWPKIARDHWETFGWHDAEVRPIPPPPKAIDQMDRALPWLYWLEPEEAKLVWARACGVPWKIIEIWRGVSRSTAWRHWITALATIAGRLNAGDDPAIALKRRLDLWGRSEGIVGGGRVPGVQSDQ
jgi:hypothetical protein